MNELVLKLSLEANNQTGNEFDLNYKPLDAFLAKFAELVVKECASIDFRSVVGLTGDQDYEVSAAITELFK